MTLQYISDFQGRTTAVQLQIPIEDWEQLKEKYAELKEEEKRAGTQFPDWHVELALEELKRVKDGTADLRSWDEIKDTFRL